MNIYGCTARPACNLAGPSGVLADHELRGLVQPSAMLWDWMHVYLSNGIAGWEIEKMLQALTKDLHCTMKDVRQFFQADWKACSKSKARCLQHATRALNDDSPHNWKGDAGTTMMVAHVLDYVLETVIEPLSVDALSKPVSSFHAMARCLRCATTMKFQGNTQARAEGLLAAAQQHLRLFVEAYGDTEVKPKHHYALHLGPQFAHRSSWVDCFALERKHKAMKTRATDAKNLTKFEHTVTSTAVEDQLYSLSLASMDIEMDSRAISAADTLGEGWQVASGFTSIYLTAKKGDLLWFGSYLFLLQGCCFHKDGRRLLLATQLDAISHGVSHSVFKARPACLLLECSGTLPRGLLLLCGIGQYNNKRRLAFSLARPYMFRI